MVTDQLLVYFLKPIKDNATAKNVATAHQKKIGKDAAIFCQSKILFNKHS